MSLVEGLPVGVAFQWMVRLSQTVKREGQHQIYYTPAMAAVHSRIKSPGPAQILISSQPLALYQATS